MKKYCLLALFLTLIVSAQAGAQNSGLSEVTLYSSIRYKHSFGKEFFNFEIGNFAPMNSRWDLNYGSLYAGEEHDWFEVSTSRDCRSVIKDLGALNWTDSFQIPAVEPFPKLKEGEQRNVTVDTSGADGKPGAPGRAGGAGASGVNGEESLKGSPIALGNFPGSPVEQPWLSPNKPASPHPAPPRAKQDGVLKIDPIFVKAVVGHIYLIHVVDNGEDYYALFRVESLDRGDHCTISWKLIQSPENRASNQEK